MVKEDKRKTNIADAKTFSEIARILQAARIEWVQKRGDNSIFTLQGNHRENGKRYRVKLFYGEEEHRRHSCNPNIIGYARTPVFTDYRYGVELLEGKDQALQFIGSDDSVGLSRNIGMLENKKYFSRKEFAEVWNALARTIKPKKGKEIFLI